MEHIYSLFSICLNMASTKKGFDFRMSKKVAELTQVVHMLFTRNHEKEVEIEALKDAYEYEIDIVIKDAKGRIEKVEKQLEDLLNSKGSESDRIRHQLEQAVAQREKEYKSRIESLEKQLLDERNECQNVRDLLIAAQKDIERLRSGQNSDIAKKAAELSEKNEEIASLRSKVNQLERQLKDKGDNSSDIINSLQKVNTKLKKDNGQLHESMTDMTNLKDQLINKNKHLETEVKQLKRELSKRLAEKSMQPQHPIASAGFVDTNDELERLRKEIQRYRLELFNREGNFNRIFSDKQPVLVHNRGTKGTSANPQASITGILDRRISRERTLPAYSSSYSTEEDRENMNVGRGSSPPDANRLPQLGLDPRNRVQRLVRPKPPPRELLSGKSPYEQ